MAERKPEMCVCVGGGGQTNKDNQTKAKQQQQQNRNKVCTDSNFQIIKKRKTEKRTQWHLAMKIPSETEQMFYVTLKFFIFFQGTSKNRCSTT